MTDQTGPVPPIINEQKFKSAPLAFHYSDGREVRQIGPYLFTASMTPDGVIVGGNFLGPAIVYCTALRAKFPPILASKPIRSINGMEVMSR